MRIDDLNLDFLARLTSTPGLPGREWDVADLIHSSIKNYGTVLQDPIGNLTVHLPGKGKRVMLMAHMDEVGLLVRRITPDGFLRVERMGGMNLRALPGNHLSLWTDKGCLDAVVGLFPQHLDNGSPVDLNTLYLDIGASSAQEAAEMGVQIGDGLTWSSPLKKINSTRISSKALDDRLGCWVLFTLASLLKPAELACDLYLTFTVQEETMLNGGLPTINNYNPDIVIGVDGTLTFDTPDLVGQQTEIKLGAGPAIKWMDTIRGKQVSYVPDQKLVRLAQQSARQLQIPLQSEIVVGLSTALSAVPYNGIGIPTLALSLPVRYHHSPVETADLNDVISVIHLLQYMLTQPI